MTDFGSIHLDSNSILCSAIIGGNATIVNGDFWNDENPGSSITNDGTITSGSYLMHVINHGTITGGTFSSTVTNNGTIKGGIFSEQPTGGTVHKGYTLNVNQNNGSYEIHYAIIKDLAQAVMSFPIPTIIPASPSIFFLKTVKQYYFLLMLHSETQTTHLVC